MFFRVRFGSEIAFFSLKSSDIQQLKNDDSNNDLIKLIERPNLFIIIILILNNFINVGIIILSTYFATTLIYLPENLILQFVIQVTIITLFLVLFGEVTQKYTLEQFKDTLLKWYLNHLF